jgi:hypothetical protein
LLDGVLDIIERPVDLLWKRLGDFLSEAIPTT